MVEGQLGLVQDGEDAALGRGRRHRGRQGGGQLPHQRRQAPGGVGGQEAWMGGRYAPTQARRQGRARRRRSHHCAPAVWPLR